MPTPPLITVDEVAAALPERFGNAGIVAADTEFNRTNTYRPELCLIQLACGGEPALVDMLAGLDSTPLVELFCRSPSLKLFHAASQDMEALQLNLGTLPNRIFDTQVAAGLLGFPAQIGYANLVAEVLGVQLDKSATRTDWTRRPLSDTQLHYAAEDVTHLFALYAVLRDRLEAENRYSWAEEDSALLLDPDRYEVDPAEAWQRLGGLAYLAPDVQVRARALAEWRESRAIQINRPRPWVLADKALMTIAQDDPTDLAALTGTDGLPPAIARRQGEQILAVLKNARQKYAAGEVDCTRQSRPTAADQAALKHLAKLVAHQAKELNIAPEVLATRKELAGLLRQENDQRVTSGWRREVIGEELLAAV